MNDHQLLCFLTVSRTLNFSNAARELYCTQPALSYQIRSLEKELGTDLFQRSTTHVALTEAGRTLLPHAQEIYRRFLNARNELRPYARQKHLLLNLPLVLLQRDPVYPILMEQLHAAFPGCELEIRTDPVQGSLHRFLTIEADAAVYLPLTALQPEIEQTPLVKNFCYLVAAPKHPLAGRSDLLPGDLSNRCARRTSAEPARDAALCAAPFSDRGDLRDRLRKPSGREVPAAQPHEIPGLPGRVVPSGADEPPPAGHRSADPPG